MVFIECSFVIFRRFTLLPYTGNDQIADCNESYHSIC